METNHLNNFFSVSLLKNDVQEISANAHAQKDILVLKSCTRRTRTYLACSTWLVEFGFNATLTSKVISWRSVTHMCFLGFSHQY